MSLRLVTHPFVHQNCADVCSGYTQLANLILAIQFDMEAVQTDLQAINDQIAQWTRSVVRAVSIRTYRCYRQPLEPSSSEQETRPYGDLILELPLFRQVYDYALDMVCKLDAERVALEEYVAKVHWFKVEMQEGIRDILGIREDLSEESASGSDGSEGVDSSGILLFDVKCFADLAEASEAST